MRRESIYRKLDWQLILIYLVLVLIGWINVFSSVYDPELSKGILSFSERSGMQFVWILTSFGLAALIIYVINPKFYSVTAWFIYALAILALLGVLVVGVDVNGSRSWVAIGPLRLQPAEFSKIATALALSSLLGKYNFHLKSVTAAARVAMTIIFPMLLIVLEKETGSALVYFAFTFMLYREGLSGWFLILGILAIILFIVTLSFSPFQAIIFLFSVAVIARGLFTKRIIPHIMFLVLFFPLMILFPKIGTIGYVASHIHFADHHWLMVLISIPVIWLIIKAIKTRVSDNWKILAAFLLSITLIYSVDILFEKVLQDHQRARIESLLGITEDLQGSGYNVHQSKIAIGSGGLIGKGFLRGTQTKFNFVPEQSTDFIFCTVGEEWGFLGSLFVVILYTLMITRIIKLAEKQKDNFNRIYGYCVASIIFVHFFINIGMTMGLVPVIGIPLPFLSYGGSSLWSFTILLFIFIRLDLERWR
ncbi:MAG: rod shape-determining protein RodA [Bacteroidales bacterium]|nr:rod shape-determining protein RodA [Bacteroidales bacterium]